MKGWVLAAAVSVSAVVTSAAPLGAADIDYDRVPHDKYGSAYDDPRYADIYGPPKPYRPYHEPYTRHDHPVPSAPVYGYEPRPHTRFAYREGCVPRHEVRRQLERDGWSGFFDADPAGEVARVKARRPDGRLYQLAVDRCTGEVVSARPLDRHFGYDDRGPDRYERYADHPSHYVGPPRYDRHY
jgi:hypothetical protein